MSTTKPEQLNRTDIIKSVKKFKGKLALVAQDMKVSLATIYNYRDRYKSVANAIKTEQDQWYCGLVDTAESKLQTAVMEGKAWAIRYALETQGKNRGFVIKSAVEHSGDAANPIGVKININYVDVKEG